MGIFSISSCFDRTWHNSSCLHFTWTCTPVWAAEGFGDPGRESKDLGTRRSKEATWNKAVCTWSWKDGWPLSTTFLQPSILCVWWSCWDDVSVCEGASMCWNIFINLFWSLAPYSIYIYSISMYSIFPKLSDFEPCKRLSVFVFKTP